jgi:hypothetical protein
MHYKTIQIHNLQEIDKFYCKLVFLQQQTHKFTTSGVRT